MIRGFFFAATTLLLPCLAFGGNPSADLSVQVVPLTPPGSGGPAKPPGPAAALGFTTLALNSDFTQQMPTNWLGGCPNGANGQVPDTNDVTGHTWWINRYWNSTYQPCNIAQVQDPAGGGLVLDIPWTVDANFGSLGNNIETASWNYNVSTGTGSAVHFPNNIYMEIVFKAAPITNSNYNAYWTWDTRGMASGSTAYFEWDDIEADGSNHTAYDSAVHDWSNGNTGDFIWTGGNGTHGLGINFPFDDAAYHTWGMQIASDGTKIIGCTYLDGTFLRCLSFYITLSAAEQTARNFLFITNAAINPYSNNGQRQDVYVRTARVWSCASWQTTECNIPTASLPQPTPLSTP